MTKLTSFSLALIVAMTSNAFAHHPLGGAAPETMLHGFLSGVGHPIIGFDHLAFVLAIGVLAAFHTHRLALPFGFVIGTVIGSLLTLAAVTLPLTELTITLSVLFAGLIVMRGRDVAILPATILGTLAGLFHGADHGTAGQGRCADVYGPAPGHYRRDPDPRRTGNAFPVCSAGRRTCRGDDHSAPLGG